MKRYKRAREPLPASRGSLLFFPLVFLIFSTVVVAGTPTYSWPLGFRPNLGQWDSTILYQAQSGNGTVSFLEDGLSFAHRMDISSEASGCSEKEIDYRILVWNIHFENCTKNAPVTCGKKIQGSINYLLSGKPVTHVPQYEEITYSSIYEKIGLRYYSTSSKDIKYDFRLEPGADVHCIRMQTEGLQGLAINSHGDLELKNCWGTILEKQPFAYQMINGKQKEVKCRFCILDKNTFGFKITGPCDPRIDLIIDPVILQWSTFVGGASGSGSGNITGLSLSDKGIIYGTGYYNASYPTTAGVYDPTYAGGDDVFVFSLDPTGSFLNWATYYGGPGNEYGLGIFDYDQGGGIGYVVVTGYTDSPLFPVTAGVVGPVYKGGISDAFVFRLDEATGSILYYATFLGGAGEDRGTAIHEQPTPLPYWIDQVTGYTNSTDFPTTAGAFQSALKGGYDAFYTALNASGPPQGSVLYESSYIGGSNNDYSYSVFSNGNFQLAGSTNSTDFPATAGSYQTAYGGGLSDAWTGYFQTGSGVTPTYLSFLGGSGNDYANSCLFSTSFLNGGAFVTGYTSGSYPVTGGAYDISYNGGLYDAFVTNLNPGGSALNYSTYVGGNGDDYGEGIAIQNSGAPAIVFVSGTTSSTNFPYTCNTNDSVYNGGTSDIFLFSLSPGGNALYYSSYFGGSNQDYKTCIATGEIIDRCPGGVILGYNSYSANFPTTSGAFQTSKLNEAVPGLNPQPGILKLLGTNISPGFSFKNCGLAVNFTDTTSCRQTPLTGPVTSWVWNFGDGSPPDSAQNPTHTFVTARKYGVTLTVRSDLFCAWTVTDSITIHPVTVTAQGISTCPGNADGSVSALVSGGTGLYTYSWTSGGSGLTGGQAVSASPGGLSQGGYTVTVTDANGCTATATATVGLFAAVVISVSNDTTITSGGAAQLRASGGVSYLWTPSGSLSGSTSYNPTAYPGQTTTYTVHVTDANDCSGTDSIKVSVSEPVVCDSVSVLKNLFVPNAFSPNGDGQNDRLFIHVSHPACIAELNLKIYDRWGELVFETTTVSLGWDGTYRGQYLNSGVFAYYLNVTLADGQTLFKKGNITLVR